MSDSTHHAPLTREIERRMKLLNLKPIALSTKAGLNRNAVQDILDGRSKNPRYDTLEKLAKALGCTVAELTGTKPSTKKTTAVITNPANGFEHDGTTFVPIGVYDVEVSAGHGALVEAREVSPLAYSFFDLNDLRRITRARPEDLALVSVIGDSMEPSFHHSDRVMVDLTRNRVYVLTLGDITMIKRVTVDPRSGLITVSSDNSNYAAFDGIDPAEAHIAGKVIWAARAIG